MQPSILPEWFKKLDTVVKLGLCVFVGSFVLIWGGMFLTRPDRSIPPYSIGSQEGTAVAVHVPSWTSDAEIETLIYRFQKIAREARNFGRMKIQPTTPGNPAGHYQRITIYVFANDAWTEPEVLRRYLAARTSSDQAEQTFRVDFEKSVRGSYHLDESGEEGRIGQIYRVLGGKDTARTAAYARLLFKGPVTSAAGPPAEKGRSPSPRPASPSGLGL